MPDYVALHWDVARELSPRIGWIQRTLAQDTAWTVVVDEPGRLVAVSSSAPLKIRHASSGVVIIGDIHARDGGRVSWLEDQSREEEFPATCRRMVGEAWGRYVVLERPVAGRAAVFRDPMGGLECASLDAAGVHVVASSLPDWLIVGLAPALSIDWNALHRRLVHSAMTEEGIALRAVRAITPGELLDAHGHGRFLWRPAEIARRGCDASENLVDLVDICVAAAARGRTILAEVSGGFDSAVVATAVGRLSELQGTGLINYHTDEPEGDERSYARQVAARAGLPLIERHKPPFELSEASLTEFSGAPRPAIWGVDASYDRDVAQQCTAMGADAILSGKGGDSVFFQMPTPLVFADHLRAHGLAAFSGGVLPGVARWTRRSAWSVLGAALDKGVQRRGGDDHPWLNDVGDLPPAKRLHVSGLTQCLSFVGASRRASVAHFIHPLLSQPIVEHCLARSSVELTEGRRDRAYARRCFESRLPAGVAWRHSKGDATAHFGRAVAKHHAFLRGYLLDGVLASQGVIDRRRLERALSPETLIWNGGAGAVLQVAALEGWSRGWQRRLRNLA